MPIRPQEVLGREAECATVLEHLARGAQLVTLVGPGGAGKTTLATLIVERARTLFPGGVVWVGLGGAEDADGVLHAVHTALGSSGPDGIAHGLARAGRVLTVLDAFDAPRAGAEDLLAKWLAAAPDAAWLVTSRRAVGLFAAGVEQVVHVRGLAESDAVALFARRMRAVDAVAPQVMDGEAQRQLTALLERLDRLPLAIELAAARVAHLGAEAMPLIARDPLALTQDVADEERHRGMHATIAWSVTRLPPHAAAMLSAVSLFRGAFDLAAAATVAAVDEGAAARALSVLIDHNLAFRTPAGVRLFDTVRAYGERSVPASALEAQRQRLLDLVTRTSFGLFHGDARAARIALEAASEDLFAAFHSACAEPHPEAALAAATFALGLSRLSESHDPATTERLVSQAVLALEHHGGPQDLLDDARSALLAARARVRYLHGSSAAGANDAALALLWARSRESRREALLTACLLDRETGQSDRSIQRAHEVIALSVGNHELAGAKVQLASSLFVAGRHDEAHDAYLGASALARDCGARRIEALAIANLGYLAFERGDLDTAELRLAAAFELFAQIDDPLLVRKFEIIAAMTAFARGRFDDARRHAESVASAARVHGDREGLVRSALVLARLDRQDGDPARARARLEDALALARLSGNARGADELVAELAAGASAVSSPCLRIGRGAYWFEVEGIGRVELATRAPLRRVLAFMAERRATTPGLPASTHELAAAGWPGERMQAEAAQDRVYTAVGTLRKLGLGGVLARRDGGYVLDPAMPALIL